MSPSTIFIISVFRLALTMPSISFAINSARVIFDMSALLLVIFVDNLFDFIIGIFGVIYGVFGCGCNANFGYFRYFASAITSGASYNTWWIAFFAIKKVCIFTTATPNYSRTFAQFTNFLFATTIGNNAISTTVTIASMLALVIILTTLNFAITIAIFATMYVKYRIYHLKRACLRKFTISTFFEFHQRATSNFRNYISNAQDFFAEFS